MDNQVLKAIIHISKKNPYTVKNFNYLQNNEASNYDYEVFNSIYQFYSIVCHYVYQIQFIRGYISLS